MRESRVHALVAAVATIVFWGWPFYWLYGHNQVHWLQYEVGEYVHDLLRVVASGLVLFLLLSVFGRRSSEEAKLRWHLLLLWGAWLQFTRFFVEYLLETERLAKDSWLGLHYPSFLVGLGLVGAAIVILRPSADLRKAALAFLGCIAVVLVSNWRPHGFYENHLHRPAVPGQVDDPQIHVIVFDGLAYDVLFDRGKVVADYPYFAALAGRSHVFHNARSPADNTALSVPGIVTGHLGVEFEGSFFCALGHRYNVWITGAYFPYCSMLECFHSCDTQTLVLKDVFLKALPKRFTDASLLDIARRQEALLYRNLEGAVEDSGNLYFTHFVLPHFPYVLDRDGLRESYTLGTQSYEAYRRQVAYTDALLGRILARMEALGQLDSTLLVVTSDHANRATMGTAKRLHVPLLVHLPGQGEALNYRRPVGTIHLGEMLEGFVERDPLFLARLGFESGDGEGPPG